MVSLTFPFRIAYLLIQGLPLQNAYDINLDYEPFHNKN